jgi:flavin reductase (DIM6/NTAB) family NADH-FMN oxidoreductase RutF
MITALHDGKRFDLTATAMNTVCAEPPRLLVCINKSGMRHEMISASGAFCVNVLGEQHEKTARAFAGML